MIWTANRTPRLLTDSAYGVGPTGRTNRHVVLPVVIGKVRPEIVPRRSVVGRFVVVGHPVEFGGLNGSKISIAGRQQIAAPVRGQPDGSQGKRCNYDPQRDDERSFWHGRE